MLTEAATGYYAVTPVLAALAGADRVLAVTRASRYGSIEMVKTATYGLATAVGVADRTRIVTEKTDEIIPEADILTNSGHVRPIDAVMIEAMKPGAVVSLMYEAWEFRAADLDLSACQKRGIAVAGVNTHPLSTSVS